MKSVRESLLDFRGSMPITASLMLTKVGYVLFCQVNRSSFSFSLAIQLAFYFYNIFLKEI